MVGERGFEPPTPWFRYLTMPVPRGYKDEKINPAGNLQNFP